MERCSARTDVAVGALSVGLAGRSRARATLPANLQKVKDNFYIIRIVGPVDRSQFTGGCNVSVFMPGVTVVDSKLAGCS